jgi:hypothetical protein
MAKDDAIIATYTTHDQAEETIRELERSGFDMKKLSIVGKGYKLEEHPLGFYTTGDRMKTWGGLGALWGGMWGLLIGAGFFWIPGIGPLMVAGPLVHMLVGAAEGAVVVGGISALGGALASIGVPKNSVVKYEAALKADHFLVIAHGNADSIEQAREIMRRHDATGTESIAA